VVSNQDRALSFASVRLVQTFQMFSALEFELDTSRGRRDTVKRTGNVIVDVESLLLALANSSGISLDFAACRPAAMGVCNMLHSLYQ
jgi:hypothetical protein